MIAQRAATGVQPTGHALPSLLLEGLDPDTHLLLVLQTTFRFPPPLSVPCQYAINHQADDPYMLANHRGKRKVHWYSWHRLLAVNPMVFFSVFTLGPFEIVEKRNIPFCRELSFIARFPDLML